MKIQKKKKIQKNPSTKTQNQTPLPPPKNNSQKLHQDFFTFALLFGSFIAVLHLGQACFVTEESVTRIWTDYIPQLIIDSKTSHRLLPVQNINWLYKVHKHSLCGLSNKWDGRQGLNFTISLKSTILEQCHLEHPTSTLFRHPLYYLLYLLSLQITRSTGWCQLRKAANRKNSQNYKKL